VFEPNGEELWANVRRSVEDFLYNEWKSSRLMGTTPEEAFFVRCDRTTMTQSNIDNGQLIALVGVSLFKPAEFVIFRIGQKTLDFKG
jgi:phage tail sheath protein FI